MEHIGTLRNLRRLHGPDYRTVTFDSQITDEGMRHLAILHRLELLELSGTALGGVGLSHLRELRSLNKLVLTCPRIDDDALKEVSHLSSLESFVVYEGSITASGIEYLCRLPRLQHLGLDHGVCLDADVLDAIAAFPSLTSLSISNPAINDQCLSPMPENATMETVVLSRTNITDKGLAAFKKWKKLQHLNLREGKITASGVFYMAKEMPHVKFIHSVPQTELDAYMREHRVATQGSVEDLRRRETLISGDHH